MLLSLIQGLSSGKILPRNCPLAFFLCREKKSQVKQEAVEWEQMEFLPNYNHLVWWQYQKNLGKQGFHGADLNLYIFVLYPVQWKKCSERKITVTFLIGYVLIPRTCDCDLIWIKGLCLNGYIKDLRWGLYPELSGWVQCSHSVVLIRRKEVRERRGDLVTEAEEEVMILWS